MYWRPETAPAWQNLWGLVREELGFGPERLMEPKNLLAHWRDPRLLLSQSCSLPYRLGLYKQVHLLGAFHFDLPSSRAGDYHSVIVTRPGPQPAAPRIAVNAKDSQSGWAALCDWRPESATGPVLITGAHQSSAQAVGDGRADLCAIDAVSWSLICRFDPALASHLTVIARTPPTPGLPLITASKARQTQLRSALQTAVDRLGPGDRTILNLIAFVPKDAAQYTSLPVPPAT